MNPESTTTAAPGFEGPTTPAEQAAAISAVEDLKSRATRGYILGLAGIAAAVGLAIYSFCSLHKMAEIYRGNESGSVRLEVFYVSAAGHVVITVTLVWFIYQLLRAAERMVLPRHFSTDPEVARTLLGISSPQREITKMMNQLIGTIIKVRGPKEE